MGNTQEIKNLKEKLQKLETQNAELNKQLENTIIKARKKLDGDKYLLFFENIIKGKGKIILSPVFNDQNQPIDFVIEETNVDFLNQFNLDEEKVHRRTLKNLKFDSDNSFFIHIFQIWQENQSIKFEYYSDYLNRFFEIVGFEISRNKYMCVSQDISKQKFQEIERRENLALLSKTAMDFIDLGPDSSIYQIITRQIFDFSDNCVILSGSFNAQKLFIESIYGAKDIKSKLEDAFTEKEYLTNIELLKQCFTSKIRPLEEDLSDIFTSLKNSNTAQLETEIGINKKYSIGLISKGQLQGIVIIFIPEGNYLNNAYYIETYVNQASIALKKINSDRMRLENEMRFRAVFNLSPDPFCITSLKKGEFLEVNDSFSHISGYSSEDIIGKTVSDITFYANPQDRSIILKQLANKQIIRSMEIDFRRKDGEIRTCLFSCNVIRFASENVLLSSIKDISDRKKHELELTLAKKKAEKSDMLKTAFLSNMSHEIRTPMNAIIGFSELMLDPQASRKELNQYVQHIQNSGSTLLDLIEDIIDVAKIEANEVKLVQADFDVIELLQNLWEKFEKERIRLQKDNIHLELEVPDKITSLFIHSDKSRILQVLNNLLNNALKFTHEGAVRFGFCMKTPAIRQLKLLNQEDQKLIEFFVQDSGIGIKPDEAGIIFERFRQADVSNTRKYGGTGLGLTISKNLIELMGGKIWVDQSQTQGARFLFHIPVSIAEEDHEFSCMEEPEVTTYNWQDKTILIAEDEELNFLFLDELLRKTNARTLWAQDGEDVLIYCKKEKKIDLILMDIQMPEKSGIDATEMIKKMYPEIPIIVQTAYALNTEKESIMATGCDDYIAKPIKAKVLLQKINNQFNKK